MRCAGAKSDKRAISYVSDYDCDTRMSTAFRKDSLDSHPVLGGFVRNLVSFAMDMFNKLKINLTSYASSTSYPTSFLLCYIELGNQVDRGYY